MNLIVRPELDLLPSFKPGRRPEQVVRESGVPEALKLSSNESPFPPPPALVEAATRAATEMHRYPDARGEKLVTRLASRFGVDPVQVTIGAGSNTLLHGLMLASCGAGAEVVTAWRSFEVYRGAITVAGAKHVRIPLLNHRHDAKAMADAVTQQTRAVIVCNPNNPTGTALRDDELAELLRQVPANVLIVLDEAYREFVTDQQVSDGLNLLSQHDNVAVLRTFSKTYGMAGLRLGVCVANPAVSDALRKCLPPFGVSHVTQQVALAAMEPENERELLGRVQHVVNERVRLQSALREQVMELPHSHANFVWLPVGEYATDFAKACEKHGVIIRPFPGDGVRITIGTAEENDKVLDVCTSVSSRFGI